MQCVDRPRDMV